MKKLVSLLIIMLSLFYGSYVFAAKNGDTTTTTVTYTVPESFVWTAPTDVTFDAADEIKTSTLVVSENIIPYSSFLVISIPEQEFVLTSSEGATRNYKVYLGENELTVGSEVLRIKAGTTEGSVDVSFKVPQVENIKAGTYTGTLNFVAKVTGDYGINYYLDGGTNNASNPSGYKMNEGDVTILEPTKLGYTFAGWYDNAKFTGSPITKIANGTSGNINLYAKWSANSYTINYNLDGGTNSPSNPSTYTADMLPLALEAPTKDGYAFLGWNDGSNDVTGIPAGTTGNVSLTARWDELSYSITYNLDGGVLSGDYPTSYTASTGLDTLPVPTKDGYAFLGWDDGTNDVAGIPVGTTGTVSLTARWEKLYTITYNLDGGTLSAGAPTTYTSSAGLSTLPTPTKDGYVFAGWQENNDVPVTINDKWGKNEDGSFYINHRYYGSQISPYAPALRVDLYNTFDFNLTKNGKIESHIKFITDLDGASFTYQIVKDDEIYLTSESLDTANNNIEYDIKHNLPAGNYVFVAHISVGMISSVEFSNLSVQETTDITSIPSGTTGDKTLTAKWEKTIISFTIGGTSYQAEEGMTWEDWVNSSYNTSTGDSRIHVTSNGTQIAIPGYGGFNLIDDYYLVSEHDESHNGWTYVNATEVIKANEAYFTEK